MKITRKCERERGRTTQPPNSEIRVWGLSSPSPFSFPRVEIRSVDANLRGYVFLHNRADERIESFHDATILKSNLFGDRDQLAFEQRSGDTTGPQVGIRS